MRIPTTTVTLTALSLLMAGQPAPARADPNDDNVTNYRFEDDLVRGDLARPDGEILQVRKRRGGESLVRIREHFVDRLLRSAETL